MFNKMEKQMKKESKASKIMKYIATHPNDKATEVAKALSVKVDSVYQATYLAKKKVMAKRGRRRQIPSTLAPNAVASMALYADDVVNHPSHYKVGGIETIDFIEAKQLDYHLGNVVKYISRADHKDEKLENLKKAQWYLNRAVANLSKT
jgi:translation initiation factor 2 alpha subunit (eIF-2alpha)